VSEIRKGDWVMIKDHPDHALPAVLRDRAPIQGQVHGIAPSNNEDLHLWHVLVPGVAQVVVAEEQITLIDDRENEILNMMPDSQDYRAIYFEGQVIGYVFLDNSYAVEPLDWLDMALTPRVDIGPDTMPEPSSWVFSKRTELRRSPRSPQFPHEYEDPDEAAAERG
jgi:hypothetical protein